MLALQRQDLVVCLRGLPGEGKAVLVGATGVVLQAGDAFLHLSDALLREENLMPHAVDSNTQTLVLALDVVQKNFFMLQFVLERRQEGLILIFCLNFIGIWVQSVLEVTAC